MNDRVKYIANTAVVLLLLIGFVTFAYIHRPSAFKDQVELLKPGMSREEAMRKITLATYVTETPDGLRFTFKLKTFRRRRGMMSLPPIQNIDVKFDPEGKMISARFIDR